MNNAPSAVARRLPTTDAPAATPARPRDALSVRAIWLGVAFLVAITWIIGRSGLYTPGSDFGYYLGLVGALMMLALLLYPLRKHVRFLNKLGAIRYWFQVHMFLGIAGPVLILLHSTYHLGSVNAAVAYYSMLIVAGSGIVGRFMYTKIHRGLYGRSVSLQEMQTQLGTSDGEMKSRFHFAPMVETQLQAFEDYALAHNQGPLPNTWRFLTLRLRSVRVRFGCRHDIHRMLSRHAAIREWPPEKLARRQRAAMTQIKGYLDMVMDVALFSTYERLFSWWHVLHVPLVYLLVVSTIVHVIAVHMY